MIDYFKKTLEHLQTIDITSADSLDKKALFLLQDEDAYEKASQALRRRFSRGAQVVEAIDRGMRIANIKREKVGGKYQYLIQGQDGNWFTPDERIWVVAMYALWQDKK